MYLMCFLDVTLDTCQDTSGYMYLGRFITIHQDTPRYKITIHCTLDASWCWHGLIVPESQVLQVNELVEMHGSTFPRPLHHLCAPLYKLWQGRHTCKEERT